MKFVYQKTLYLPFHLGDPAAILFFGHVFSLVHETYESFIQEALAFTWDSWFQHPEWIVPIKHTEASYQLPIKVGLSYTIQLAIKKIGTTSFTLTYYFMQGETLFCEVETVHVFCNKQTFQKEAIPPTVLDQLKNLAQ